MVPAFDDAALEGEPSLAVPDGSLASPADFYGFPSVATPGGSSGPSTKSSSVPRDSEGIPLVTPATVTVRRGSSYGGERGAWLEDDALAANLFCATSPGDSMDRAVASTGSPGGEEVQEFGGFQLAAGQLEPEAERREAQEAGTPAVAGGDFSFFPAAATVPGPRAEGITPGIATVREAAGGGAAGSTISPEILGYYEQQAQQAAAASGASILPRWGREGCGSGSQHALPRLQAGCTCTHEAIGVTGHAPSQGVGPRLCLSSSLQSLPTRCRSIIKPGRPLQQAGTPVLGRAQRAPPGQDEPPPPPTVTRELQALMADLRLEDPSEIEQVGPARQEMKAGRHPIPVTLFHGCAFR